MPILGGSPSVIPAFPDVELAVITYLAGKGFAVAAALPPTPPSPFTRVIRIGGVPAVKWVLDAARLQLDTWADTKQAARNTAAAVEAAMYSMPFHVTNVSDVGTDLGLTWQPDDLDTPPKPRYLQGFVVYIRA